MTQAGIGTREGFRVTTTSGVLYRTLWFILLLLGQRSSWGQQALPPEPPEAPQPQCLRRVAPVEVSGPDREPGEMDAYQQNPGAVEFPPSGPVQEGAPVPQAGRLEIPSREPECVADATSLADLRMCCSSQPNFYARFLNYRVDSALTSKQKLGLAWRSVRDPFNLLTVGGEAAFAIGVDAHTAYGPGLTGFARYAGISLTQDSVSVFLSTFLIPSLAHQDPRYRRRQNLPVRQRIFHVIDSVVVAQGDDELPMFNYATVFGVIGTSALGNLYVPGRRTNWEASAARISVALATVPIGNAITEFLPDVARHINVNVVLVQRVINRVAIIEGAAPSS